MGNKKPLKAAQKVEYAQNIVCEGREYNVVKEGLAEILNLKTSEEVEPVSGYHEVTNPSQAVFYNPIQQFNRDLSVLAIRKFGEDFAIISKERRDRLPSQGKKGHRGKKRKRDATDEAQKDGIERRTQDEENEKKLQKVFSAGEGDISLHGDTDLVPEQSTNSKMDLVSNETAEPPNSSSTIESGPKANGVAELADVPKGPKQGARAAKESDLSNPPEREYAAPKFRILDALSATGLRALRYAKEIPFVTSVTANDLSSSATASIKLNIQHNDLLAKVYPITGDALTHMYRVSSDKHPPSSNGYHGKYHVIDLDPYGSAVSFLDAAVQALQDGGLLCVTCTDAGVFASAGYLEKTFSQYGGLPFKGPQSHEAALRLALYTIATTAARYGIAIEPLLSLSIDFYIRIFVRVHKSAAEVKFLAGKTMLVYNCDEGCGAWETQYMVQNRPRKNVKDETIHKFSLSQAPTAEPFCLHCGVKTHLSGPMWGGPLHNPYFIQQILDDLPNLSKETYPTIPRIEGMLTTALHETLLDPAITQSEERPNPPITSTDPTPATPTPIPRLDPSIPDPYPFFFIPSVLAKVVHCVAPSTAALRGALLHAGYRVTRSHAKPGSIRTNAPWSFIWEMMREWVRQKSPVKENAIKKGTAGWGIMRRVRCGAAAWNLGEELKGIARGAESLEGMKVEIEAALYRAGKAVDGGDDVGVKDQERGGGAGGGDDDGVETDAVVVHVQDDAKLSGGSETTGKKSTVVVFDEGLGKEPEGKKLVRYQLNPHANWGPMNRARRGN